MIFLFIVAGVFVLDYAVKGHVNESRLQGSSRKIAGDKLILRNCHNKGLAFGILKKTDAHCCQMISSAALGGILWETLRTWMNGGKGLKKAGLALILGGGANNFAERIQKGYVTDYVSVNVKNKKIRSLAFNLSDLFIVAGTVFWTVGSALPHRTHSNRKR